MTMSPPGQDSPRWRRRLTASWRAVKREVRDALELFLIPATAVVLPWPVAYRLFRLVVERTPLYGRYMPTCLRNAERFLGPLSTEARDDFVCKQKMLRLLDQADYWLIRFRPAKASAITQVEEGGEWLDSSGFLALCNHWGAGFLGIHHLREQGHTPLILYREAPLPMREYGLLNALYIRLRRRQYHRLSGGHALPLKPEESRAAGTRRLLKSQNHPLLMADAPGRVASDEAGENFRLKMGHSRWRYPVEAGFTRLITRHGRDFVEFSVAFDYASGQRLLRLRPGRGHGQSRQALLQRFQDSLNQRLAEDPAQWQFWHVADTLLQPQDENTAP